jgi:predicted O-methyltransferase YrrM
MREKIIALYGPHVLKKSVISIRGGAGVIPEVLNNGCFKTALEIGTYRGVGAAEMSQCCEKIITIDLKRGKLELANEHWDRRIFWDSLGITNIEFHAIADDYEKAELVAGLEFDFALIDGAHDATVARDFELVKRCGTVLFHDADRRGSPQKDYVIDFIESLPQDQVTYHDIFALWQAPRHG